GPDQWPAEDRDLARDRGTVGGPSRPRDALVEAVQPARADRLELRRRRLVLDHDGDAAELIAKGCGQRLEGIDHHRLDVVVARIPGKHRKTIAAFADRPVQAGVATSSSRIDPMESI